VIARDSFSIQKLTHNIRGSIAIMSIPFASEMLSELDLLSLNTTDFEKLDAKFVEVNNIVNSYCELYKDEVFEKNGMIIA
jgi:hypothetical protein